MKCSICMGLLAVGAMVAPATAEPPALVPAPVKIEVRTGHFTLTGGTPIRFDPAVKGSAEAAAYLASVLEPATGFRLRTSPLSAGETAEAGGLVLAGSPAGAATSAEGYRLESGPRGVVIRAGTAPGLFYGIQTLRQLLPPAVFAPSPVSSVEWTVPCVVIDDQPRYSWRGLHLDVGRHFMPVEFVKRYIDLIALHKMNVFHWHLTEDQGWRIEIKKYPRLTEVGSIRKESPKKGARNEGDGTPYGPFFYTQEQVREVVAYAAARHVTVVPEIEMPGHSLAALVAYPELSCTGGPFDVRTKWGVEPDIYCAGNDRVFPFIEDVLNEVLALFPSPFIHIGGDEAPKDRWNQCPKCQARIKAEGLKDTHELQSWFIKRIDRFLASKGRRLIGWDEILEGGLAPGAAVMSWRGIDGGIAAAKADHDVVMTPTSHCYLDYAQARGPGEPEAIGGYVPLRTVYALEPTPAALPPDRHRRILGAQGNLWTEYLFTPADVEYFAFPRACALSEVVWSPAAARDYAGFRSRLARHLERLDALQVRFRPLSPEPVVAARWKSGDASDPWSEKEWTLKEGFEKPGRYRIAFQYTHGAHRLDIEWAELRGDGVVVARVTHPGTAGAAHKNNAYVFPDVRMKPGMTWTLRARVRADGGSDSNGDILVEYEGP